MIQHDLEKSSHVYYIYYIWNQKFNMTLTYEISRVFSHGNTNIIINTFHETQMPKYIFAIEQ